MRHTLALALGINTAIRNPANNNFRATVFSGQQQLQSDGFHNPVPLSVVKSLAIYWQVPI
jgi:hypothetical protein